jgi:hypothetical protein
MVAWADNCAAAAFGRVDSVYGKFGFGSVHLRYFLKRTPKVDWKTAGGLFRAGPPNRMPAGRVYLVEAFG